LLEAVVVGEYDFGMSTIQQPTVRDVARQAASEVLRAHTDGTVPVDPYRVAKRLGMKVRRVMFKEDISGALVVRRGKTPEVLVSVLDSPQRQRFTCAHEIGHYIERVNRADPELEFGFLDKRGAKQDAHEYYADEFAGSLLMPEHEVRRLVDAGVSPIEMAGIFDVSIPAMRLRMSKLNLDG
jgi:Zn-dependent peptidase ImmA (M78 family)